MTATPDTIYQLKIILDKIKPPIWRRVQVTGASSLADMHRVIQVAFDWDNSHMHQFVVGEVYYGDTSDGDELENESVISLTQVVPEERSKFKYEYDFGDLWIHTIVVEKIAPAESGIQYPRCLTGKRAAPPEDIGGRYGYAHLLEVILDPEDEDYERLKARVGENFDPETFDLEKVNNKLQPRKARLEWFSM